MNINLTNSYRDRQAILSNSYLIRKIEEHLNAKALFGDDYLIRDSFLMSKRRLSCLLDTHKQTVDRYIKTCGEELKQSGYKVLTGKKLHEFKAKCRGEIMNSHGDKYGYERKYPEDKLEIFTFKAWLNMAMLLPEGEVAKFIRLRILDLAIDVAAEKEGGRGKHLKRQIGYEYTHHYRQYSYCSQEFKSAIEQHLKLDDSGKISISENGCFSANYSQIEQLVFSNRWDFPKQAILLTTIYKEYNTQKYRNESSFRLNTSGARLVYAMYHDVFDAMSNIEQGVAEKLKSVSINKKRKLEVRELNEITSNLGQDTKFIPLIEEARTKMAIANSLNANPKSYKDILNQRLETHERAIESSNIDEFMAVKLKKVKEKLLMSETFAVFQRLSDRDNERQ